MIIARSRGRLGNQLFVFAALESLKDDNERIFLLGFDELVQSIPSVLNNGRKIHLPRSRRLLWKIFAEAGQVLGALGVFSVIILDPTRSRFVRSRGLLATALFRGGWCQDERLINPDIVHALLQYGDSGSLNGETAGSPSKPMVGDGPVFFVHIRRGDYLTWPSPEFPAALPESWYRKAMEKIRETQPRAHFLVLSDDMGFAEQFARKTSGATALAADPREALVLMSRCVGGVLSPSTFSWWGAQLASRQSEGPFIAPLHWITWGERRWDDSHSLEETTFLTWMPVVSSNHES